MSEATEIEIFDEYLKDEFSRMGFNYHEMKASIIKSTVQDRYEMSLFEALDKPYFYADCFEIVFLISNAPNQPKPFIESVNVALCLETGYDNGYCTLIEKKYLADEGRLPSKNQMIADTKDLLRIKITQQKFSLNPDPATIIKLSEMNEFDKQLEKTFSALGFNYHEIEANGINKTKNDKFQLFSIEYLDDPYLQADGLAVIFTISSVTNEQKPIIESMHSILFNDSLFAEFTSLIEKKYLAHEGSLPTKEQILNELKEQVKIKNVREKFEQRENNPSQSNSTRVRR